MSIKYDPDKLLKKIAPAKKIAKLLSSKVSLKKTALSFLNDIDFLSKKKVSEVALKTIKGYKKRIKASDDPGDEKSTILDDPKQLIQRVQNEVIFQVHQKIKAKYDGQNAKWLPSSADEPRPEHQLNYGKIYVIGVGIDGVEPGDEYGCQCGVEILTDETQLNLGD